MHKIWKFHSFFKDFYLYTSLKGKKVSPGASVCADGVEAVGEGVKDQGY